MKNLASLSILILFAAILASCGHDDTTPPVTVSGTGVVGGAVVDPSSPLTSFVVQVRRYTNKSQNLYYVCSGVVIASDIVLTAAHCFADDTSAFPATIAFGTDADHPTDERNIRAFSVHPSYNTQQESPYHDLALVKFSPALPSTTLLPKIVLKTPAVGTRVDFAGYGLTTYDLSSFGQPLHMRTTAFSVMDLDTRFNEISVVMTAKNGIGRGDSGGPLFIQTPQGWTVLGVAAEMTLNTSPLKASFTLLAPNFAWIQKSIVQLRNMK
jgi:secreted trypsin-like serine protease